MPTSLAETWFDEIHALLAHVRDLSRAALAQA